MSGVKTVFISYSHDSDEHREKVLGLAERLRQDGLKAQVDQYVNGTPEEGWPRWMLNRLDEADFVLVVCTETYYRRFRGHEVPDRGKGADWEGGLITQELYDARNRTVKFVPVLMEADQESFIPEPLRAHTCYELTSEESYQNLYHFLLGQAGVTPGPLGDIREVEQKAAPVLTFDPAPRRLHRFLWPALPTVILLPLVGISTFWRLPTRVQLELETVQIAINLGGTERHEILNRSVPFSSLDIEDCSAATFFAEKLEMADPQQLVPGTKAGEEPHFPAAAWREIATTDPVKLSCRDPAARLTLQHPDPAASRVGLLDRLHLNPGSQVILAVLPGREPALSLETETPQKLSLPLGSEIEIVSDLVEAEGMVVPFPGDLLTWRARLPEARQTFDIKSAERGLVLIITPARDQAAEMFREPLDLPLVSVELLEETLEGTPTSPLRGKATLSYPAHGGVPSVIIEKDEAVRFDELSQARLRSLVLDAKRGVLRVRFDGIVGHAASKSGELTRDHRLTLFHNFFYKRSWELIALASAWLLATAWAAFGAWKKLRSTMPA